MSVLEVPKNKDIKSIFEKEWKSFVARFPSLKGNFNAISDSINIMTSSLSEGRRIITCGNGGSASDAEHIVGELLKGFYSARNLSEYWKSKILKSLPNNDALELIDSLQSPIPAFSLMGHPSFTTAFNNDKDSQFVLAQHLFGLGEANDVLVAITTSGNSKNVIKAVQVAKVKGIKIIGLTGESGGELADLADVTIKAPTSKVHEVQELHLPIYHFICIVLEKYFFD